MAGSLHSLTLVATPCPRTPYWIDGYFVALKHEPSFREDLIFAPLLAKRIKDTASAAVFLSYIDCLAE